MTPQQLKNSILQLAIEGKLVEQNAEDGNSKEFLEELLKDTEKFNKSNGRYDCNKFLNINENDMPFSLPSNWCWVRLGDICSIARGGSPRPIKDYITNDPNGINWIKIGDTNKDDKYINKAAEKIKPAGIKKTRFVYPGDFLLTNSMSFGRPYILNIEGCIHDGWLVISQYEKLFDKNFLFWVLSSRFAYEQFCKKVSGAVVKNLNIDKVAKSIFPVPPIREQIRIVERIEKIFSFVDLYAEKWGKLEELNQKVPSNLQKSLLQEALQGKISEQKVEDGTGEDLYIEILKEKNNFKVTGIIKEVNEVDEYPFDIPDTWKWVKLGNIIKFTIGRTPPRGEAEWWGNDIPWVSISDMSDYGYIKETKEMVSKKAIDKKFSNISKAGTLLMSFKLTVGRTSILDCEAVHNEAIISIIPFIDYDNSLRDYLFYVLPFLTQWGDSRNAIKGKTLNSKSISNLLVPLPPLREQKRIVEKIEKILPLINQYRIKLYTCVLILN